MGKLTTWWGPSLVLNVVAVVSSGREESEMSVSTSTSARRCLLHCLLCIACFALLAACACIAYPCACIAYPCACITYPCACIDEWLNPSLIVSAICKIRQNQTECTDVACEEASKQSRRLRPVDACPPTAVGTVSITLACNCHDCSSHGQVGGTL